MKLQENMITIRGNRTKSPGKRTKTERMLGTNRGKSLGKWRKPERMLGANHDDTVNMLENTVKVQENVITTRGNGAKRIGK